MVAALILIGGDGDLVWMDWMAGKNKMGKKKKEKWGNPQHS